MMGSGWVGGKSYSRKTDETLKRWEWEWPNGKTTFTVHAKP